MAINYNEHTWKYGEELTPDNFNNIEKGIKANADAINEANNNLIKIEAVYEAYTLKANEKRIITPSDSPFKTQTGVEPSRIVAVVSPMIVLGSANRDNIKIYLCPDSGTSFELLSSIAQDAYVRCLYIYI